MIIIKKAGYIGILGFDTFDLSVYLSMILKNLQYRVSVADTTCGAKLFIQRQASCPYSYKNIYFHKGPLSELSGEWDFVLVLSEHADREFGRLCDRIYIVADNSYGMTEYIKGAIRESHAINGVIFRDVTDNGINAGYIIKHVMQDDYMCRLLKDGAVYQIRDDLLDREYKTALGYEGITDFKRLSADYLKVLSEMAGKITGKSGKIIERALAKAKEGEIVEYSILE